METEVVRIEANRLSKQIEQGFKEMKIDMLICLGVLATVKMIMNKR